MHSNYYKQNTMLIVNYHSESVNLTNSNHHWHTVVTAPHSIVATVIGLFVPLRSWTMKVPALTGLKHVRGVRPSPKFFGGPQFSLSYSAQQSALTYVHTTASFHLGKFGDDRYSSFVVEKKYSAEVRPNFGTRSACAPKYSASAEHCKGHVRCISILVKP